MEHGRGAVWIAIGWVVLFVSVADAQTRRAGLWGGLSWSYGAMHMTCDECPAAGRHAAGHLGTRLGMTLNPHLLLAVEVNAWNRSGSSDAAAEVFAVGYWYPSATGNWYVKGGGGYVAFRGTAVDPPERGSGAGVMLGGGLDIPLARSVSLGPMLTLTYDGIGTTEQAYVQSRTGLSALTAVLGIALTFH